MAFLARKFVYTAFLSWKFVKARSSIALKDLLWSLITPQIKLVCFTVGCMMFCVFKKPAEGKSIFLKSSLWHLLWASFVIAKDSLWKCIDTALTWDIMIIQPINLPTPPTFAQILWLFYSFTCSPFNISNTCAPAEKLNWYLKACND